MDDCGPFPLYSRVSFHQPPPVPSAHGAVHLLKGLGIFVIQDLAFLLSLLNLLALLLSQSSTWRSWIVSQFRSGVTAEAGWEEKCLDRVAPNPDRKYLFWVMPFSSPGFSSMTRFANMLVELLE